MDKRRYLSLLIAVMMLCMIPLCSSAADWQNGTDGIYLRKTVEEYSGEYNTVNYNRQGNITNTVLSDDLGITYAVTNYVYDATGTKAQYMKTNYYDYFSMCPSEETKYRYDNSGNLTEEVFFSEGGNSE